jgi:3-hydroxyisobutyrate dehydrogenase-like beta-hydroxyacid dehydrogenase
MGMVGIVGLGIMGSAYAKNLIAGGATVLGADPLETARRRLTEAGGTAHERAGAWLADCDLVILALASPSILRDVTATLAEVLRQGQVVLETGTFALADKTAAHAALEAAGVRLLDCPVSGTGAQAAVGDRAMFLAAASPSGRRSSFPPQECNSLDQHVAVRFRPMNCAGFGSNRELLFPP